MRANRSVLAASLYALFNPIPFGCFVSALIFDILYSETAVILWDKGAAWLLVFGLLFAVIPRLVNLTQVWFTSRATATRTAKLDFWLNLLAIVAAFVNSLVHSRDAYGSMPSGLWLSILTVLLIAVGKVILAVEPGQQEVYVHE